MNVVIINKSDFKGGAAVFTYRLMNALRQEGVNASMLVAEKLTDSPHVHIAASDWKIKKSFLWERLKIFLTKGVDRSNLFKIDTAAAGLPIYNHPLVKEADIICLNWVNQGILSLKGLRKLTLAGKPVVWTMHDMWCFTGICHHAGSCRRFEQECGECRLLGSGAAFDDLSRKTWLRKFTSYGDIHFVAVSNWLANLASESSLLHNRPITVIPNTYPYRQTSSNKRERSPKFRILFGAARLDDPVKGLPILIKATELLSKNYPDAAAKLELITFGTPKDPHSIDHISIAHTHLGRITGEDALREVYKGADAVVSTSLYESFGGTLVEGQMSGCIPIAFDRGGQADIIDHLETGYLARWDDDVTNAAGNIARGIMWAMNQNAEEMEERMLKRARQKFDAPVVAKKYIELFNRLI